MKKKAFRLRAKPEEPQRRTDVKEQFVLYDGDNLGNVVDWAEGYDVAFKDIRVEREYGYYGESDHLIFYLMRPEPDEALAIRMAHYERQLELYNEWEAANKEAIAEALAEREKKAEEKKKKDAQKERKKNERELAAHEKEAARLRKKLII